MVKISSSRKLCLIVAAILGVAGIVCLCTSHPLRGIGFLFLAVVFAAPKRKRGNKGGGKKYDFGDGAASCYQYWQDSGSDSGS